LTFNSETIITVELDLDAIKQIRDHLNVFKGTKPEHYKSLVTYSGMCDPRANKG